MDPQKTPPQSPAPTDDDIDNKPDVIKPDADASTSDAPDTISGATDTTPTDDAMVPDTASTKEEDEAKQALPDDPALPAEPKEADTTTPPSTSSPASSSSLPDMSGLEDESMKNTSATAKSSEPAASAPSFAKEDTTAPEDTPASTDTDAPDVPTAMPAVPPKSPNKKKWFTALVIFLIVLVVGAAAAAAYVGYYLPRQPKYVLARAFGNTATASKLRSAHFDGTFSLKASGGYQAYTGTLAGKGTDKSTDFTVTLNMPTGKINLQLLSADGKTLYLRPTGLEALPSLLTSADDAAAAYTAIAQALNNQWIELDSTFLQGSNVGALTSNDFRLSDADAKKLENAYKKHIFMDVSKVYDDEKIHGVDSFHYRAKVNESELTAFLKELQVQKIKNLTITNDEIDAIKDMKLGQQPIEVWIAKESKLINKIAFETAQDGSALKMDISMSKLNEPVTILKPSDAKSLAQILSGASIDPNVLRLTPSEQAN